MEKSVSTILVYWFLQSINSERLETISWNNDYTLSAIIELGAASAYSLYK